jgi:flagella basal body P-ring formation protein FlgA
MMHAFDIARPLAVERGKLVTIIYAVPMMSLSVQGVAQEQGGVGDAIRVTNTKSNTTVIAEVIDARTVRIGMKQTASAN